MHPLGVVAEDIEDVDEGGRLPVDILDDPVRVLHGERVHHMGEESDRLARIMTCFPDIIVPPLRIVEKCGGALQDLSRSRREVVVDEVPVDDRITEREPLPSEELEGICLTFP